MRILQHGDCPDPKITAMFIFGAMNWIPRWYHLDGTLTVEALTERLSDIVLRALGAPRSEPA